MQTGVLVLSGALCLVAVLFIRRIWQVHKFRIGLLRSDFGTYLRLAPYDTMVFRFWRPLSSFIEEDGGQPEEPFPAKDNRDTDDAGGPGKDEPPQPVD